MQENNLKSLHKSFKILRDRKEQLLKDEREEILKLQEDVKKNQGIFC